MKLIVGLGNPGAKYSLTRHNIGFMAIDALAQAYSIHNFKAEHKAETFKVKIGGHECLFAKPQTFMNLSGESVQSLVHFYKVSLDDLLVVHDEVDLPFGAVRFQVNRGHGGNNGIRSIHQCLGDKAYGRLKLGVSRPSHPGMDMANWVLQNFKKDELEYLANEELSYCIDALESFVTDGINLAATKFNRPGK